MTVPVPGPSPPGLSVTSLDFIKSALRLINVLATGETPDAAMANDSLVTLNQLIDSWQAESLMIFTIQRQVFPLAGGTYSILGGQVYTMGPGGDFNVARPAKIDRLSVINLQNSSQPLELPLDYITDRQWQGVPVKNIASSLPQEVWDDGGYPLRSLTYWPVPNQFPVDTAIYSWTALTQFADLGSTQYTFPPAYLRAIRFNLAMDLALEYGVQIQPSLAALAISSKAVVEAINVPLVDLKCDPALVTTYNDLYNWITDQPVRR